MWSPWFECLTVFYFHQANPRIHHWATYCLSNDVSVWVAQASIKSSSHLKCWFFLPNEQTPTPPPPFPNEHRSLETKLALFFWVYLWCGLAVRTHHHKELSFRFEISQIFQPIPWNSCKKYHSSLLFCERFHKKRTVFHQPEQRFKCLESNNFVYALSCTLSCTVIRAFGIYTLSASTTVIQSGVTALIHVSANEWALPGKTHFAHTLVRARCVPAERVLVNPAVVVSSEPALVNVSAVGSGADVVVPWAQTEITSRRSVERKAATSLGKACVNGSVAQVDGCKYVEKRIPVQTSVRERKGPSCKFAESQRDVQK